MNNQYFDIKITQYEAMQKVFSLLLNEIPDITMIRAYIDDSNTFALQNFCSIHLRKEIFWSTGIGVIDSAITIYNESISNGNIKEIK